MSAPIATALERLRACGSTYPFRAIFRDILRIDVRERRGFRGTTRLTRWVVRHMGIGRGRRDIQRTAHSQRPAAENVRIYHRRTQIGMPQKLLDRADVVADLQQVSRK
jgi:hypothetical protein